MKKYLIRIFLFLLVTQTAATGYGQSSALDSLLEPINKIKFEDEDRQKLDPYFIDTYFSNVYQYFDLEETYNTPLKKEVFKNSKEYKALSDSLAQIKKDLLKPSYIEMKIIPISRSEYGVEYDLKRNGFKVLMNDSRHVYDNTSTQVKNVIDYLSFTNLPFQSTLADPILGKLSEIKEYLFLPVNKNVGLEVEDENNDTKLIIIFTPTAVSKKLTFYDIMNAEQGSSKFVLCNVKKVLLVINDEIKYSKRY
jgi:hypothetical protein